MAGKINVGVLVSIVRRMILGLIIINKVIHIREERCELGLYSETRRSNREREREVERRMSPCVSIIIKE